MNRANLIEMFCTPETLIQPEDAELKADTEHPNLNSKQYRKKSLDVTIKIQSFFENLTINSEGEIILTCNNYNGRIWDGSIWGFINIEDIGRKNEDKSVFRMKCASPVTDLRYVEDNIVLFSESNGSLQLWSTRSEVRSPSKYCLFSLGHQSEHTGIITAIDLFNAEKTKAVSVSNDYCIKIWDMGSADLTSIVTMRNAHFGNITGVSSSHSLNSVFVTCSHDKSVLLWDYRLSKPASGLCENHVCGFSTIYWESGNNNVLAGDEIGHINLMDIRNPKEIVKMIEVFDKPIHKIKSNEKYFAVCGNTNSVAAFNSSNNTKVYEKTMSKDFVRDICWIGEDNKSFYTTDWDAFVLKHVISI